MNRVNSQWLCHDDSTINIISVIIIIIVIIAVVLKCWFPGRSCHLHLEPSHSEYEGSSVVSNHHSTEASRPQIWLILTRYLNDNETHDIFNLVILQ